MSESVERSESSMAVMRSIFGYSRSSSRRSDTSGFIYKRGKPGL